MILIRVCGALRCLLLCGLALGALPAQALSLGMQLNPDRVRPGEAVMAQITVTNDSAVAVANVTLQSRMPAAGVTAINEAFATGGAVCPFNANCDPNELVTWTVGLLAPGTGVTVSLPMTVSAATADGTVITVPAAVLVNGVQQLSVAQSVTVDGDNALMLSLDADKFAAAAGDTLTYTLTYGNRSTASISSAALSLPLPAGVSFVSASGGGTQAAGVVSWTLGTLQAGQSARQQVVVTVNGGLGSGTLLPVAAAQLAGTSAVTGAELARAHLLTRVQAAPVLALAYAVNADPVRPGEAMRTTLTVSNRSAATVFGAVLRARMPTEGMQALNEGFFSGAASCPFNANCDPYELANWALGTLAPGESVTLSLPMSTAAGMSSGRLIVHEAELRADGVPMTLARHTVAVDADNALALAVDVDKDSVAPGELLTYSLVYGNRVTSSVSVLSLRLPLPPGVSFVSASGGGTLANGVVSWTLGTLQAGQSGRQQVQVTVAPGLSSGTLLPLNGAQLSGNSAITGAELARASLVTRVQGEPALGLAYAINADPVRPGEAMRPSLTVTNRSSATVFGAVLRARLPTEGMQALNEGFFSGGASCPFNANCDPYELATWALGTLAPGESVAVSLPMATAAGFASGRLVSHEAELRADGAVMMRATRSVAVDPDGALALAVDSDQNSVEPGALLRYTLTFGNRGNTAISGATLRFPLPEGSTLAGSSGGTLTGRTVSWNLGTLLAGSGGRRSVTVAVPAPPPPQARLVVDAAVLAGSSAVTGAEEARASLVTRVMADNPLKLAISLSPNPAVPGQTVIATLSLRNSGAVPLISVVLQSRAPTEGTNALNEVTALGVGGSCPFNANCDPYELGTWNVGTLAPGASATRSMALPVTAGFGAGRLIAYEARATDDATDLALTSASALVGVLNQYADGDGDGVVDAFDNCSALANADQADFDHDGFGDRCDGDFDNSGVVNFVDLGLFRSGFGSTNRRFDLSGDGLVNFVDLGRFRALFGRPPGPSGLRP